MKLMKAAELVLDFDLYPRFNVASGHVSRLADAISAGVELPPVVIDRKSKRVSDGFHRVRAYLHVHGSDAQVPVIEKNYKSDAELFQDAMRYNGSHGAPFDTCSKTRCMLIAEKLQIPIESVAAALSMTVDKLSSLRETRTAATPVGLTIPLKRTIRQQFSGKQLNQRQVQANERLSGMNQSFYANQLIELIESDMLDKSDEKLMERLCLLHELLSGIVGVKSES